MRLKRAKNPNEVINKVVYDYLAYSSTAENHKGTIYIADGWFLISETKSATGNWESRPNRTNRDLSKKLKFGRTP
jgi:hypothetical protein